MSTVRRATAGVTRTCPHCRAVILDRARVCPACKHHLRFGDTAADDESFHTIKVDGTITHPGDAGAWEYSVLLTIRNGKGEEIGRHLVGVGALEGGEQRSFTLDVEVFVPPGSRRG